MTIAFDAEVLEPTTVDLPTVDYENAPHPAEAHRRLAAALSQGRSQWVRTAPRS
jgi:hypothetical protein